MPCLWRISIQAAISEESGYLAMRAMDLLEVTVGAELILNPGSEFGKEFVRDEIAAILDGSILRPNES